MRIYNKSAGYLMLLAFLLLLLLGCQEEVSPSQLNDVEEPHDNIPKYFVEVEKLDNPLGKNSPASSPGSFKDNILLTSSLKFDNSTSNAMLFNLSTSESTTLDFYAGWQYKMDDEYYYYLTFTVPGSGLKLLNRKNQSSGKVETIYTVPEDLIADGLTYGNEFLLWTQFSTEKSNNKEYELWAYDIKKDEAFMVADKCFGISYIINNGYVGYYTEDDSNVKPYIMLGYDLNKRQIATKKEISNPPISIAFDGETLVWCETTNTSAHSTSPLYMERDNQQSLIMEETSNADIYLGEYIVFTATEFITAEGAEGFFQSNFYVYSITDKNIIYSSVNQDLFAEDEGVVKYFMMDNVNGKAVFYSLIKGGKEFIYVMDFIKA